MTQWVLKDGSRGAWVAPPQEGNPSLQLTNRVDDAFIFSSISDMLKIQAAHTGSPFVAYEVEVQVETTIVVGPCA